MNLMSSSMHAPAIDRPTFKTNCNSQYIRTVSRQMRCVLAACVLGALLLASTAAAEQTNSDQTQQSGWLQGARLNHRRALRLVIESTTGYWWWDTKAETKVTLVPAKSLKPKPAAPTIKLVEEQLSTAHLEDVDLPEWYKHKVGLKDDSTLVPVAVVVQKEGDTKAEAGR